MIRLSLFLGLIFLCRLTVIAQDIAKKENSHAQNTASSLKKSSNVEPAFPGGYDSMYTFIQHNFDYPQRAIDEEIEGLLFVQFTILPNGYVSHVKMLKGLPECAECEEEALKVVRNMPRWRPAREGGKNVAFIMNLPITMELSNID